MLISCGSICGLYVVLYYDCMLLMTYAMFFQNVFLYYYLNGCVGISGLVLEIWMSLLTNTQKNILTGFTKKNKGKWLQTIFIFWFGFII